MYFKKILGNMTDEDVPQRNGRGFLEVTCNQKALFAKWQRGRIYRGTTSVHRTGASTGIRSLSL